MSATRTPVALQFATGNPYSRRSVRRSGAFGGSPPPSPGTPENSFLVFGEPLRPPPNPRLPPNFGAFLSGFAKRRAGACSRRFFGWVRYAIPVRLIHRFPRTPKNSYLVFGKPRHGPHSPKGEGFQFRPARRPICDGGEQGVWGWRGVSRAVRGGNPQRTSRSDTFEVK